jgi:peptidoglycan/xylan/chitin deacetylase (PgdA/CDA1 family)
LFLARGEKITPVNLKKLHAAPLAVAYLLGMAGSTQRERSCARILMLHATPRAYARNFERQLRFLKRHFEVVSLAALVDALDSPTAPLRRKVAITFDDGLKNNVEVAYPILERLGVPATFFVCPQLIERGQWLWNHEVRRRLLRLASLQDIARETGGPAELEAFIGWMKMLPLARRRKVEERVRAATPGFAPTTVEKREFDLASWEDLRRLDPRVVTIGSHTLTHPILPSLSPAELELEMSQSRRALEGRLDRQVDLFAYPNGDVSATVHDCARRHYRAAVSVEEGWVGPLCDPHSLPRVSMPWTAIRLAWLLHLPMPQPMALAGLRPIFA